MDHPLIQHKIGIIRDKDTGSKRFPQEMVGGLPCWNAEATRDLKRRLPTETPIGRPWLKARGQKLAIVPILRAGLGIVRNADADTGR